MRILQSIILVFITMFLPFTVSAQNYLDVLRFSENFVGGTARNIGIGGAYGALGADMSSLSINPAGIGVYRTSEFTVTPGLSVDDSKATLYDQPYSDTKYHIHMSNIGYVFTYNSNKDEGWVSVSLGIAYNRLNDFNSNVTIYGNNPNTSLLDGFTSNLNKYYIKGNPLTNVNNSAIGQDLENDNRFYNYENLAFKTNTVFVNDPSHPWMNNDQGYFMNYFTVAGSHEELQQRTITTKGGTGEYAFALGANYSHKLYLGMTVGIDHIEYQERKVHTETGIPGQYLDNFTFIDDVKTSGTGVNAKFGIIFKPVDVLRFGAAFHTPTFYNLSSDFYTTMDANYKQAPVNENAKTFVSTNDYEIHTPYKFIGSVALQFKQYGVLSLDYEYLDYTDAKIRSNDDPYTDVNTTVQNIYRATNNLRIGGELKFGDISLRAGYGMYGSPFKSDHLNKDASTTTYSAGIGFRGQGVFLDLGYVLMEKKYKHVMYEYEQLNSSTGLWDMIPEYADVHDKFGKFVATLGFRF